MGAVYADVADVIALGRPLTAAEAEKAPALLETASALLRQEVAKRQYDLDSMIAAEPDLALIARQLTVSAVVRGLDSQAQDSSLAVSQATQSGLGYSATFSYVNAGQSMYFLRNELKQLGILRQRYGTLEVYGDADP